MENKIIDLLIKLSNKAAEKGNTPIAAIITKNKKIISKAYNKKNKSNISIDHAEIIAIKKACKKLKTWRLNDCEIYVTLEPCKMCYYAIAESRIRSINFILKSKYSKQEEANIQNIQIAQISNDEYSKILKKFFEKIR